MSGIGTVAADNATTTSAKLKHIGTSLLPLALFVASTLGYEQVVPRGPAGQAPSSPALVSTKPASGPTDAPTQRPISSIADERTGKPKSLPTAPLREQPSAPRTTPDFANALRDERSLLELSRIEAARIPVRAALELKPSVSPPDPVPAVVSAAPAVAVPPAVALEPVATSRVLATTTGSTSPLPLGFRNDGDGGLGAYAIVRGVPPKSVLSHGIAVGDDSWLIDGADIAITSIDLGGRTSGKFDLEFAVLSATSVLLYRETLTIDVKNAETASVAAPAPIIPAIVAEPPLLPGAEPTPATVSLPFPQPTGVEAAPVVPAVTLRVSRDTNLIPGRGGLLKLDIEPAAAIPVGAFVVVRGLPVDTVLSRGMSMGPQAWLLTLAELSDLEVRLPATASGTVHLSTTLITVDGNLIAADKFEIALHTPPPPAALPAPVLVKNQPVVVTPPVVPQIPAAGPRVVTRAIALPAIPPANAPLAKPSAVALTPAQIALARGRRMLDIGNIAAARPMLERSALEGSGDAAALLGASFDADWLRNSGALGITADAGKARYWYDEARKLGVLEVERITSAPKGR